MRNILGGAVWEWIAHKALDYLWFLSAGGGLGFLAIIVAYASDVGDYWIGLAVGGSTTAVLIIVSAIAFSSRKPKPNLRFRKYEFNKAIIGNTGYAAFFVEIGNDLLKDLRKQVGDADGIRAQVTYFDDDNNTIDGRCPARWSHGTGGETRLLVGASDRIIIAVAPDHGKRFATDTPQGKWLDSCAKIVIILLNKKGKALSKIELSFPINEGKIPELLKENVYRL